MNPPRTPTVNRSHLIASAIVSLLAGWPVLGGEEIPSPPDEREEVLKLLDALVVGGPNAAGRARQELKGHAGLAGPLLRQRLENPELPNWVTAADALAEISPAELDRFEAALEKAPPGLAARYHLWRLARGQRPPWESADFLHRYGEQIPSPNLAAIGKLGKGAVPEIVRAMGDPELRNAAAYAAAVLKLRGASGDLVKLIRETQTYAHHTGGHAVPPSERYSLAVLALAEMGEVDLLCRRLTEIRFTIAPRTTASEPRDEAELIVSGLLRARAEEQAKAVLARLVDGPDPAVRSWALERLVEHCRSEAGKYALPIPLRRCIALLDENEPDDKGEDTKYPTGRAHAAAGYLAACGREPEAIEACVAQFERGRFVDLLLGKWVGNYEVGQVTGTMPDWSEAGAIRRRLAAVALELCSREKLRAAGWQEKFRAVGLLSATLSVYDPAERDPAALDRLGDILLNGESETFRASAAGVLGDSRLDVWRGRIFDIFSQAAEKEMGRPELKEKGAKGEALAKVVRGIPWTLGKDPTPLLEKVLAAPVPEWPRAEAIARLAKSGNLRNAWPACARTVESEPASLYFGIHLLPLAVEKANAGDWEEARAAIGAITRLVTYPEDRRAYYRYWERVTPDKESAAVARLAGRHIAPGLVKLAKAMLGRGGMEYHAISTLQVREAIPLLVEQVTGGKDAWSASEALSGFKLEDRDYDRLLAAARDGKWRALRAISGTPNPKSAGLYDLYARGENREARHWLAVALLRAGDERGVKLCTELVGSEDRWDDREKALLTIGSSRTAGAAQALLDHVNAHRWHAKAAIEALGEIGKPAVPSALRALADPTWPRETDGPGEARVLLIKALGRLGDERAEPILKWLCSRQDRAEAAAAFQALAGIGTESARAAVLELAAAKGFKLDWETWSRLVEANKDLPGAGEFFLGLAEKPLGVRDSAALLAAKLTKDPEATRKRLYALWLKADPGHEGYGRQELTKALTWLGEKRVAKEAFRHATDTSCPVVADTFEMRWDFEAVVRLDREGLIRHAEGLLADKDPATRRSGLEVLSRLGVRKHEKLLRGLLDSPDLNERCAAARSLAAMKVPGIAAELRGRMEKTLPASAVVEALGVTGTDEAAGMLLDLLEKPESRAELTRDDYWRILRALRQNGSPRATEAYRRLLVGDLAGQDVPRARTALEWLAEVDREVLGRELARHASSPEPHLRCLALYGFMKHFGYQGKYDPFEVGAKLQEMVKELAERYPAYFPAAAAKEEAKE